MPINGCPSNRSLCVEATGRRHDQAQASSKPTLVFDIMVSYLGACEEAVQQVGLSCKR